MKLKFLTSILFTFIIMGCKNNSTKNRNNDNSLSSTSSSKTDSNDNYFLGNWYDCDNGEWVCFIKINGENYICNNKFAEQVFTKKSSALLEGAGGLGTIEFDKSSNHLMLNDNGSLKLFCKAHGNDADANDKTSRENMVNYSDRIGEKPSNTKIGNLEVMNKDFDKNGFNWQEAINASEKVGNGWRLPTKEELNILYQNKAFIGGFSRQSYWSSTEEPNNYDYKTAWDQTFQDGKQETLNVGSFISVRLVRTN